MKPITVEREGDDFLVTSEEYGCDRKRFTPSNKLGYHLCRFIAEQGDHARWLGEQLEQRDEKIQDLRVELEQEKRKLRQFKRTFVEARALHDLRNFVMSTLQKERSPLIYNDQISAHENASEHLDGEMRRFIKQYQDRVESWPVDAATGEVLPHVKRAAEGIKSAYQEMTCQLEGVKVRHSWPGQKDRLVDPKPLMREEDVPDVVKNALGINPRMPRCDLRNEDTTVVTTKVSKGRVKVLPESSQYDVFSLTMINDRIPAGRKGRLTARCATNHNLYWVNFDFGDSIVGAWCYQQEILAVSDGQH